MSSVDTSGIDPTKPVHGNPLTANVRANFAEVIVQLINAGGDIDTINTFLAGIEAGAKDDQTGAEIKVLYEAEVNAFTDALYTKLFNIETAAKDDQAWGDIGGTLASQTDLNTALGLLAALISPALTGTPTAPTAAVDTNTTQLATTAFTIAQIASRVGISWLTPKASDPSVNDNGDALAEGAIYRNTTSNIHRTYDGAAWADLGGGGGAVDSVVGQTGVVTATQILTALLVVDGTGSGLDADLLDGVEAAAFALLTDLTTHAADTSTHGVGEVVGATETQVLTNKTLTSPDINGGTIDGLATDLAIVDGGTGQGTAQAAIDALSAVSSATNEHVLTKDTATGNAVFKAAAGGGGGTDNLYNASLVKLIHPDESKGLQELPIQGVYPSSFNQQNGGMGFGGLPDGTLGEVATGAYKVDTFVDVANAAGTSYRGQGLKVGQTTDVASVWMKLFKVGNPTNNLELNIYDDSSDLPNAVITNGAATAQSGKLHTNNTDGGWVKFVFATAPNLTGGTLYHLGLNSSGAADGSNYWSIAKDSTESYPMGSTSSGDATPTWGAESGSFIFIIEPVTNILQSGLSGFDGALHGYEGAPLNQSGGHYFKNSELNHKRGTIHLAGTGWDKDKTFYDSGLGVDANRIVLRCNVTTGYAQVDLYENDEAKHSVTGTTDISTGNHIVDVRHRAEGDGSDFLTLYVDGASEGTPLTSQTFVLDRAFEDGHTTIGGGFPLAPTWTDSQDMSALPSAGVYSWGGAATETDAFVVSGGIGYQNGAAYGATQAGYNEDAATSFVNATGGCVVYGNEVESTTNGTASAEFAVKYEDDVNVMNIYHHEYFIELNDGSNVDYIQWDGTKKTNFIFTAIGSDCYLYANGKMIFDGTGVFDSTGGTNKVGFGDYSTSSGDNATGKWHYFKYYEGVHLPEYSAMQMSELACWSDDKSALLDAIYNSGTIQSVKTLAGMNNNFVDKVNQVISVKGVTSSPTTTSTSFVPIPEMEVFVFGSAIDLRFINSWSHTTVSGDLYLKTTLDSIEAYAEEPVAGSLNNISLAEAEKMNTGLNYVAVYIRTNAGTIRSYQTRRVLIVEAK